MNVLKFLVIHDNIFYRYILCVTFFHFFCVYYMQFTNSVSSVYLIPQNNEVYKITTIYTNWFWLCAICMYINIYNMLWGNTFSYKKFLILTIIPKEDHHCSFEIWLFWTALIGILTLFNGHHWQFCTHIRQWAR